MVTTTITAVECAALRRFVDDLPEPERQVIEGLYFEQVGLRTLAKRLRRSKRTVGRIRDHALLLLQADMEATLNG